MNKYLFLQHWTGELNELCRLSSESTAAYAAQCGADYRLLRGNVFDPKLCPYNQKMFILDKSFDKYDIVAMTDMDMFPRKGLTDNLFTDATGAGVCDEGNRHNTFARLLSDYPQYSSRQHPFWGGSIYRFEKYLRVLLRKQFKKIGPEWHWWNKKGSPVDEGLMHRCAMLADLSPEGMHLPDHWSMGHFRDDIHTAGFVHIRNGARHPNGDSSGIASKMDNYLALRDRGIV